MKPRNAIFKMVDLEGLRKQLDAVDREILSLLEKRFAITDKVAGYKNAHNISLTQRDRELQIIQRLEVSVRHAGLKNCIRDVYESIFTANKNARLFGLYKTQPFKRIGVIGLGLIGGSIVKALKQKDSDLMISTVKRDTYNNRLALTYGITEYNSLADLLRNTDLIILASTIASISAYAQTIKQQSADLDHKLVVIDVASVKESIAAEFEALTDDKVEFVATHPMAGSHNSGFAAARANLFVNQPWVITPHAKNKSETIDQIKMLLAYLGARTVELTPYDHDRYVAVVSHLIFLISTYLFAFASETMPVSLQVAGSGFRTTTRLASGNVEMHAQIVVNNFANIIQQLKQFMQFVNTHSLDINTAKAFFAKNKYARDQFVAAENK